MKDFILDPYLKLYLPLWKRDGSSIMSDDAYGFLCAVTGALWGLDGRILDGDDWINLVNVIPVIKTQNATILVRLKATSTTGGIVSSANSGTLTSYIQFGLDADKLTATCMYKSAAKWTVTTDAVVNSGNGYLLVGITHNGTAPTLWVNGRQPAQAFSVTADKTVWFGDITDRLDYLGFGGYMTGAGGMGTYLSATAGDILWITKDLAEIEMAAIDLATTWRYV